MIPESNSIPMNNWKGNLRSCRKWTIFKGRRVIPRVHLVGGGRGGERIVFRTGHLFQGKGMASVLSCRLPLLPPGDGEGPHDWLPYWSLTRKFQPGRLRLHFWERLKLQVDQALNLGLVSWAFSTSDAILGLWFSFQCLEEKRSSWKFLLVVVTVIFFFSLILFPGCRPLGYIFVWLATYAWRFQIFVTISHVIMSTGTTGENFLMEPFTSPDLLQTAKTSFFC